MSIKELLNRDAEVENIETPSHKEAIIGFLVGFVGYMVIFPSLIFYIFVNMYNLTKETPQEIIDKYQLISQIIAGGLVLIILIFFVSFSKMKNVIKNIDGKTFSLGIKYFIISYICVLIWNLIYMLFGGTMDDNANQDGLNKLFLNTPLLTATLTCIIAPLIEELIFRYYMYKGIEDQNPIAAVFITAFLFAFIHLIASIDSGTFLEDLKTFPNYFIPSLILTFAYYKHRKLGVSIVCHMTNNIFATVMMFLQQYITVPGSGDAVEGVIRCLLG